MEYAYRYFAGITVEASTPIAIGCGEDDLDTDSPVTRDLNGLPYIPATALAGIIRERYEKDQSVCEELFGNQDKLKGHGSEIVFTEAKLLFKKDGKVCVADGLLNQEQVENNPVLNALYGKTVRHHVRINKKGCSDNANHGKFDNEIVLKGARFYFEVEILSQDDSTSGMRADAFKKKLLSTDLRIGGGIRKGYGRFKIKEIRDCFLTLPKDTELYAAKSSKLDDSLSWKGWAKVDLKEFPTDDAQFVKYTLRLKPQDFFLFGSGHINEDADMTPVYEKVIVNGESVSEKPRILIPGSSVKGAIYHRFIYHYNLKKGYYADNHSLEEISDGETAAQSLFGYVKGDDAKAGKIYIDDNLEAVCPDEQKLLNHVVIDSFTGGAIAGGLFTESVSYSGEYTLSVEVEKEVLEESDMKKALELSLSDICNGNLALGGGTNRGHGCFIGKMECL